MTQKHALLIVDMLNTFDFPQGDVLASHTKHIIAPLLKLKEHFNKKDWPIIYVNDHYQLWKADFNLIIDYVENKLSKPIIGKIKPDSEDYFLIKPKHSGFYGTALDTLLQQLDVESVVVTGVAGNICVLFTANDAYMREYKIIVPENTMASETKEYNDYALDLMKTTLKADTRPVDELIKDLS